MARAGENDDMDVIDISSDPPEGEEQPGPSVLSHSAEISWSVLDSMQEFFEAESHSHIAMNSCFDRDPVECCLQHYKRNAPNHIFTHKVDFEAKPVTNQKNSGRCWIFAALNVLRVPFMKALNLEEFEFSQNFIFFYDKVERCNYFLCTVKDLLLKGEAIDGRLLSFLLQDPVSDGGQWDMVVNIIEKYGLVPKDIYPESFSCTSSSRMNMILKSKLRAYVWEMSTSLPLCESALETQISCYRKYLYKIIATCLGIPPGSFTFEYYDKDKTYHSIPSITPVEFYNRHVKPHCCITEQISLVNDPRQGHLYGCTYTVDCLGNVIGGRKTVYVNQSVGCLMQSAVESLKNNVPVWFGCEVDKNFDGKAGVLDTKLYDYEEMFGTPMFTTLDKANRLVFGDSKMNHAMVLTGVSLDSSGEPTKWRVENSWGEDKGKKGYLVMTSEWFREFVFEVVVDPKFVPAYYRIKEVAKKVPIVLPAWDPMGSLAQRL